MRVRTLLSIGVVVGLVGAAAGCLVDASGADDPGVSVAAIIVGGLSIVTAGAIIGFVAGAVAVAAGLAGTTTWRIGWFICETRGLPTATMSRCGPPRPAQRDAQQPAHRVPEPPGDDLPSTGGQHGNAAHLARAETDAPVGTRPWLDAAGEGQPTVDVR